MRPVGPDVDFLHVADVAALDVLDRLARVVERVPLVAHLGGDLGLGRLLRQGAGLVHRPAQRLLHVDVLAERHGRHGDRRVGVIGRRHDDAVDVLLLRQHLAVVLVALRLAGLGDQGLDVGGTPLGGLQPGRGRHRAAGALRRRWRVRVGLERGDLFSRLLELRGQVGVLPVDVAEIDVAEGHDVLAGESRQVAAAHAADADAGDVEGVARRLVAGTAEDVARHDGHAGGRGGGRLEERPTRGE